MARLADLVTVLYRPQETMRRVLAEPDRWTPQVVVLAFVAASVRDADARRLDLVLPGMGLSAVALIALGLIAGAAAWVCTLYLLSWIATYTGHLLGGTGSTRDVRAGLAWGMVPVIWSALYRIPFAILASRYHVPAKVEGFGMVLDFIGGAGCSIVLVYLAFQLAFFVWCLIVGSFCVAEAQQLPAGKAFASIAAAVAVPLVVIASAVAAIHLR